MYHQFQKSFESVGEVLSFLKGSSLTEQYAKAENFYILLEGKVNFYINVEEKVRPLWVGKLCRPNAPLGWSGLNTPNRYTSTIKVTSKTARVLRIQMRDLCRLLQSDAFPVVHFYQWLNIEARKLIEETGKSLGGGSYQAKAEAPQSLGPESLPVDREEARGVLRKSPFFEVFDESFISALLPNLQKKLYASRSSIYETDEITEDLLLLHEGMVDFYFYHQREKMPLRAISNSGYIVGWAGLLGLPNIVTAQARGATEIYTISRKLLIEELEKNKDLSIKFHLRILWLITHQLQALRARLVMKKYDQEWLSIQSLIEQNATRLKLDSALHKIPFLLKNPLTLKDGFNLLEYTIANGDSQEKYIANSCLDILTETKKEENFYEGLIQVYQEVINAKEGVPALQVRKACAQAVGQAFRHVDYEIEGWENLPKHSGHIFIYNHLKNHDYNTLPNKFQITLDSHFISSIILHKHYGDPGLRIVRIGRGNEYGHQEYYERLGHINVFTPESDAHKLSEEEKSQARAAFYKNASQELAKGRNLIISPEGTSYHTEESPGPFKPGAFNLALNLNPEPLIVPITLANFDRRVRYNTFKCVIHKPVLISNHLSKDCSKEQMQGFLSELRNSFKTHIQKAISDPLLSPKDLGNLSASA